MLRPVSGQPRINTRVIRDRRKIDDKEQPQNEARQSGSQKKAAMLPKQQEHVANISRIQPFSKDRTRKATSRRNLSLRSN